MSRDTQAETSQAPPCVVMLSRDLVFVSRVKAAARIAGLDCHVGAAIPEQNTDSIQFVILDLSTQSGQTGEVVRQCAQRCPHAKLIAYGPHVQVDKLEAAHQAGIATVMTNGQFSSRLSSLFER